MRKPKYKVGEKVVFEKHGIDTTSGEIITVKPGMLFVKYAIRYRSVTELIVVVWQSNIVGKID